MSTNFVTDASGKNVPILNVRRVCWHVDDHDDIIDRAIIIGRCLVDVAGGGQLHGLVVASPYKIDRRIQHERTVDVIDDNRNWQRYAVWWDRYTSRFVATEIPLP